MDEIPLLRLRDDDPENLLSIPARRRIAKAKAESDANRMRALADAQFEFESAGEPGADFAAYILTSRAYREVVLESIRAVLRVQCREYAAVGPSTRRLRDIMLNEIEGIVSSAENHGEPVGARDRRALESEFFLASYGSVESDGGQQAAPRAGGGANMGGRPIETVEVDGERIKSLRGDTKQKTFCRACKISEDNLQRAESGHATQRTITQICKYARKKGQILTPDDLKKNPPQKPQ